MGYSKYLGISGCILLFLTITVIHFEDNSISKSPWLDVPLPRVKFSSPYKLRTNTYALPVHHIEDRGITHNSPCLQSRDKCLGFIEEIGGVRPELISFKKYVPQPTKHARTNVPFVVPNIVHYVHYGSGMNGLFSEPFEFYHYVSYKATTKFIKPIMIILWGDKFSGKIWERVLREVPNVYYAHVTTSRLLFGVKYFFGTHLSDVARVALLRGK